MEKGQAFVFSTKNDIINKIIALESELAALKKEVASKQEQELDCYFGDGYCIAYNGLISGSLNSYNKNDYTVIHNKEVAEQVTPLVQIQRALINFKCEHDPVFDLSNIINPWAIELHYKGPGYAFIITTNCYMLGSVWFSTIELAEAALEMLKRRQLI